jgi:predicted amidohydrolase YtcJ
MAIVAAFSFSQGAFAQGAPKPSAGTTTKKSLERTGPDLILIHGVIYTGEGFDKDRPKTVEAMAVGGGRVIAVGSSAEIARLAGTKTTVRDLKGSGTVVFPGFNDAHTHLGSAGQTKLNVNLTGVASLEAMLRKVRM